MDQLNTIINKRLNQHKLGESARAAQIVQQANDFFKKNFSCSEVEVKALSLKEGVLYVGTAGAGWSQEVFLRRQDLIRQICKEHGPKSVLRLSIKSLTSF